MKNRIPVYSAADKWETANLLWYPTSASIADGVQIVLCPQIYCVLGKGGCGKDLLGEIVPGQDVQLVIDLYDCDDPARRGGYNFIAGGNGSRSCQQKERR